MLKTLSSFLIVFCLPVWLAAQGAVNFSASADARQIILGGTVDVYFTLTNADGTNFQPPTFRYFKVLAGPSRSVSTSNINGRWSKEISFSYTLQPETTGKFPIKAATIDVDGKTLKTTSITVEVLKNKTTNATTQQELEALIEKQIFLKAIPNVESARIGEQISLDYKIYTSRDVESYNIITESEYPGFFVQEIRRYNNRPVKEVIDGIQYTTKVLRRVALYPQQAGLLTVDPMQLQVSILAEGQRKRRRSFFSSPAVTRLNVISEPVKISVRSIPEDAPNSFSGAVGHYTMKADVPKVNVSTDDAISLRMEINGDGDVKQVQAPELTLSTDLFEVYEPNILDESIYENNGRINGKKLWEYLILPKVPGQYRIQPEFTYFDVDSSAYVTLKGNMFPIYVRKGADRISNGITDATEEAKDREIRFIKTDTKLRQKPEPLFTSKGFYAFLLIPLFLFGGVVVYKQVLNKRANIDSSILKAQRARRQAKKRLTVAEGYMKDGKASEFYDETSKALFGYVCDKLKIPLAELTKNNVKEKLEALNVDNKHIDRFMQIIHTCEMALFAGKDNSEAMAATYKESLEVVTDVEKELGGS